MPDDADLVPTHTRTSSSPHPSAHDTSTLDDDDPLFDDVNQISTVDDDEDDSFDFPAERELFLQSISFQPTIIDPSPDVLGDDEPIPLVKSTNSISTEHEDSPTTFRAQIDTGTFASVTDQLHLLHDYQAFTPSNPCPLRLLPATVDSDCTPKGWGYLHVPCANLVGYAPVRTFYHPDLRTTVLDERDFPKANGYKNSDFKTDRLTKHHDVGTWTFQCHHRLRSSEDILVHGLLRHGKCYTAPLIPPILPISHSDANESNSVEYTRQHDPDFNDACEKATIYNIYSHQEEQYTKLRNDLSSIHKKYHSLPFHEYIQDNTPIAAIKAQTERLLWHQRLGHPSDYYLLNAHKFVKGVPKFAANAGPILCSCPTCIQAKQTKNAAGPNTTRTAQRPYQGLSIDFSFSGMKSKNEERTDDYLGIHDKSSWILIVNHFSRRYHGDTCVSKASPIHRLRNFLETHAPHCPDKYVFLDQGGELYANPEVRRLFER